MTTRLRADYMNPREAEEHLSGMLETAAPIVRVSASDGHTVPVLWIDTTGRDDLAALIRKTESGDVAITFTAALPATEGDPIVFGSFTSDNHDLFHVALHWSEYAARIGEMAARGGVGIADAATIRSPTPVSMQVIRFDDAVMAYLREMTATIAATRTLAGQGERTPSLLLPNDQDDDIRTATPVLDLGVWGGPTVCLDMRDAPDLAELDALFEARRDAPNPPPMQIDSETRWMAILEPMRYSDKNRMVLYFKLKKPVAAEFHVVFPLSDPRAVEVVRAIEASGSVFVSNRVPDDISAPTRSGEIKRMGLNGMSVPVPVGIEALLKRTTDPRARLQLGQLLPTKAASRLFPRELAYAPGRGRLTLGTNPMLWDAHTAGLVLEWADMAITPVLAFDEGAALAPGWASTTLRAETPAGALWELTWSYRKREAGVDALLAAFERRPPEGMPVSAWLLALFLVQTQPLGERARDWLPFLHGITEAMTPVLAAVIWGLNDEDGFGSAYRDALPEDVAFATDLVREYLPQLFGPAAPLELPKAVGHGPGAKHEGWAVRHLLRWSQLLWEPTAGVLNAVVAVGLEHTKRGGGEGPTRMFLDALSALASLHLWAGGAPPPPTAHPANPIASWLGLLCGLFVQHVALITPARAPLGDADLRWLYPDLGLIWQPWRSPAPSPGEQFADQIMELAKEHVREAQEGDYVPDGYWRLRVPPAFRELHAVGVRSLRVLARPDGLHVALVAPENGGVVVSWTPNGEIGSPPLVWGLVLPPLVTWELHHLIAAFWRDLCVRGPRILVPASAPEAAPATEAAPPRPRGRGTSPTRVELPRPQRVRVVLGKGAKPRPTVGGEMEWSDADDRQLIERRALATRSMPRVRVSFTARRADGSLYRASDAQRQVFEALPETVRLRLVGFLRLPAEGVTFRQAWTRAAREAGVVEREAVCKGLDRALQVLALRELAADVPAEKEAHDDPADDPNNG